MVSGETYAALEFVCEQLPGAFDLCRLIEEKLELERELAARERLAQLYASGLPRADMREHKATILASLGADMRALEQRSGVRYPLYEEWIDSGLNNARLASVSTYYDCVPGFTRLLRQAVV